MIRTAVFGGSFNPVHIGHLAIANYLCEEGVADELWLLVSPQNPLKQQTELLDERVRLMMARAAVDDYPKIRVSDFEFGLPRPSYTINTLEALEQAYPDRKFAWVIGADNWQRFHKWVRWEEILDRFSLIVYPRAGFTVNVDELPASVVYVDAPLIQITSTFIRESVAEGKDMRFYMPDGAAQIVRKLKLYRKS